MNHASSSPSSSVSSVPSVLNVVKLAVHAMGTRFELVLVGDDEVHLRAVGEEAIEEIRYLHEKFSYFSSSSIVTRINQQAAHGAVDVDHETFELLALCRDVWEQSDGAFDITIAPIMHEFGFREGDSPQRAHRTQRQAKGLREPISSLSSSSLSVPSMSTVVNLCGMEHVELNLAARTIHFAHPGMAIDLGAVAKGYALDRAAAICRESGIPCGLLHGGTSTVVALGSPPTDDRGWGVKIRDETEPITIHLRNQALAVSAPRGRTVRKDGDTLGHIIDPRTGRPTTGVTTAAVIANKATLADAWSTALLVHRTRPIRMPDGMTSMIHLESTGWQHDRPSTLTTVN